MLYLLGHKNPDTDAICAPLARSAYCTNQGHENTVIRLGEINNETHFVLEYTQTTAPVLQPALAASAKIFLLDHNELAQSIDNRDQYDIVGLIDHHAIGTFSTNKPLMIRTEPVGCTCTIIKQLFDEKNYVPNKQIATLMISAIISDTLFFRSPTTTQADRDAVHSLNTIAQISDLEGYAMQMFDAKSDLTGMTSDEIITMDYKIFSMGTKKIAIGVIETTNPQFALSQKDLLLTAMQTRKIQDNVDSIFIHIVDILQEENITLVLGKEEETHIKNIYNVDTVDNIAHIGNKISRKKQLVPACETYFQSLEQ